MSITKQGLVLVAFLSASHVVAFGTEPKYSTDPNVTPYCTYWSDYEGDLPCVRFLQDSIVSLEDLLRWNPSLGPGCNGLVAQTSYCVEAFGEPEPEPEPPITTPTTTSRPSTTTTRPTTTTAANGVATPSPIQSGMVSNCNKFDFVDEGMSCSDILDMNKITIADFYKWNPGVGSDCRTMFAEVWVCVSVIGWVSGTTTTTTRPATTTTVGNGVQTPQPTQGNMVTNCNKFDFVEESESCNDILTKNKVSLADFYKWNPSVGSNCNSMWAKVNVCVGVIGGSPGVTTTTTTRPTTTTTRPGNGIQTPQPTQPGMVSNCDRFAKVNPGQNCAIIGANNGVLAARIIQWNTGVGPTCSGLQANVNVCVRTIGYQSATQRSCSSVSTDKTWGGNQPAALTSVTTWCNGAGSGKYGIAEPRSGCFNAPQGQNLFYFESRNNFQAPVTITPAKCREFMNSLVNGCERGGSTTQEGWTFSAYVRAGRC